MSVWALGTFYIVTDCRENLENSTELTKSQGSVWKNSVGKSRLLISCLELHQCLVDCGARGAVKIKHAE